METRDWFRYQVTVYRLQYFTRIHAHFSCFVELWFLFGDSNMATAYRSPMRALAFSWAQFHRICSRYHSLRSVWIWHNIFYSYLFVLSYCIHVIHRHCHHSFLFENTDTSPKGHWFWSQIKSNRKKIKTVPWVYLIGHTLRLRLRGVKCVCCPHPQRLDLGAGQPDQSWHPEEHKQKPINALRNAVATFQTSVIRFHLIGHGCFHIYVAFR